ncbi:MAG: hypothetical protein R3F27_09695 [Gammaproteobacteria bacterium]
MTTRHDNSLNRACDCRTLDPDRLRAQLESEESLAGVAAEITRTRPHMFSATAVFISRQQLERMTAIIAAVESVVQVPAYREAVLARAPEMARTDPGPRSVFMGFDFHLLPHGPQLIEINTNAGGPLLNVALARAQQVCCAEVGSMLCSPTGLEQIDTAFVDAFRRDWTLQRGDMPLSRIAIVDDDPLNQYLYPEFQLFRRLFRSHGIDAVIADAAALEWREGCLWHAGQPIDLVYNRLVDFYLEAPSHAALREAYVAGGVVLTPHPHAHALYADKRNLVLLSAPGTLEQLGVAPALCAELRSGIPPTVSVSRERSEELWGRRRQLFFKPARGYGSKAAYRGDKLTRRVWEEILAADYVAQEIAPASERLVRLDDARTDLKFDIRAFVYDGSIQLLVARLYAGQTTNFRTPGGGFAPVFIAP